MRNLLFVTLRNSSGYSGGMQCSVRNLSSVEDIFGKSHVFFYPVSRRNNNKGILNRSYKILNILSGYTFGLTKYHIQEILQIIERETITDIFLDGSIFGIIAKRIKKYNEKIRITTFFHNVEYFQVKNNIHISGNRVAAIPILHNIRKNEQLSCTFSDRIIALNQRDSELIKRNYNRFVNQIIPISFKDHYVDCKPPIILTYGRPLNAIFVGSYFLPNIEGLIWFTEKVLPFVDINLTVIGNGMKNIISKINSDLIDNGRITILGTVDDLSEYYEQADLVIMPLLSGGGMKVKTAEALMYGKLIVGTLEAFCGYDENSGIICHNEAEFISILNNLKIENKYNPLSRDLFENKYSYSVTLGEFKKVLS